MQATSEILMVRPIRFGFNEQTAASNAFQRRVLQNADTQEKALSEFDHFVKRLTDNGVNITVVEDTLEPHTPDSIFPNNWISTHRDGSIYLYPMESVNRRAERRPEVIDLLRRRFQIKEINDLSYFEKQGYYLESTGSMVLDRIHHTAYACLSPRTHHVVLNQFAELSGYKIIPFHGVDTSGTAIYHTNVMMSIGSRFSVICLDAIPEQSERSKVINELEAANKEIIEITLSQAHAFAGNVIELKSRGNECLIALSDKAFSSFRSDQIEKLEKHGRLIHAPLSTIEDTGGGSARCMIAEIHLPLL